MQVIDATETVESTDNLAPTRRKTPGKGGGVVPTGLAGYTYDGAAYCPVCAEETIIESSSGEEYSIAKFPPDEWDNNGFGVGVISCSDEWDYPGASCHRCHDRIQTNVIVYE